MSDKVKALRLKYRHILLALGITDNLSEIVHYRSGTEWHFADPESPVTDGWIREPLRKFAVMLMISSPPVFYAISILRIAELHSKCAATGRTNCCKGFESRILDLDREYERSRSDQNPPATAMDSKPGVKRGHAYENKTIEIHSETLAIYKVEGTARGKSGCIIEAARRLGHSPNDADEHQKLVDRISKRIKREGGWPTV